MKYISLLSLVLLFSCGEIKEKSYEKKGQSTWIVKEISYKSKTTAIYLAKSTDTTHLNESSTWFSDSIGAFKVGDILILAKKNE